MLKRNLSQKNSAVGIRLNKFGLALQSSPPFLSRSNQLLFLCGANRGIGVPSARRHAIKSFVEGISKDVNVIYAEGVFNELAKTGHKKNVLDLEHEISDIADKIIIVLESPSAFCELGAFAHQKYRNKLIIINDSHFRSGASFINTGPIAAAMEAKAPVLWYPMLNTGVHQVDGIGSTFKDLKDALGVHPTTRAVRVTKDLSELAAHKIYLYFIHDLVLFLGPLSHEELIDVLSFLFGKKKFDILKRLLGVLKAADLIHSDSVNGTWIYKSVIAKPFMRYGTNIHSLMASFRSFHLRTNPERFSCG